MLGVDNSQYHEHRANINKNNVSNYSQCYNLYNRYLSNYVVIKKLP